MSNFQVSSDEIEKQARKQSLKILIWGPGNPGKKSNPKQKKAYKKRLQIRDSIRKEFTEAEVFLSEDPEMQKMTEKFSTELLRQAAQAAAADCIIMLDLGRGVDLELDHFVPKYSWFRTKVHIFLPKKYKDTRGLVKEIYKLVSKDQISYFTPTEFEKCTVAKEKAVNAVLSFALGSMLTKFGA